MKRLKKLTAFALAFMLIINGNAVFVRADDMPEDEVAVTAAADSDIVLSYVDDKINISDEVFYGQYDEKSGKWLQKGYLDYEAYPAMSPIQEAARRGDYAAAKYEAREYYREQYESYPQSPPASPGTVDRLYYKLMQNNVQLNNNSNYSLYGILKFGKSASRQELDMMEFISDIVKRPDRQVTLYLMGLKKDGTSVSIDSKDAQNGNGPVLEITTKGVTYTVSPTDDATISPAENQFTNYGAEPTLLVEESVSSINSEIMVDSKTKRAFLKYDLSSLDLSADPTRAVLKFYGENVGEGSGEVIVMGFPNNAWAEDNVTWYRGDDGAAIEHAVFSNYGLPSFTYIHTTPTKRAKDGDEYFCAYRYPEELVRFGWLAYYSRMYMQNPEKNEEVAHDFLRQWVGYLDQHGNEPRYANGQLDGSVRDRFVALGMQWYIRSEYMTPDLWSATLKYFWLEMDKNRVTADGNNNYRTYQVRGIAAMLAYFKEFAIFEETFEQLLALTESNAEWMIKNDGSLADAAMSYASNAVKDLLGLSDLLGYAGINRSVLSENALKRLRLAARYVLDIVMPGGYDSQWGDSNSANGAYLSTIESIGKMLDMPDLLYIGTNGESGERPDTNLARYPDKGVFVTRTGWGENDICLFTDIDGNSGTHGHNDDLAVILHAYGQKLLTDQSFYSYTVSVGGSGVDLSAAEHHNTVIFNNSDQISAHVGDTIRCAGNSAYDNFTLSTASYEPSLTHTRNFLFIKPYYFIINDYLVPQDNDAVNNYKQLWHFYPLSGATADKAGFSGRTNFTDSANIQIAQANIEKLSEPSVKDGYYAQGNSSLYNSQYLQFEKNDSGKVVFDTLLYPEKKGENAQISTQSLPLKDVSDNGATAMSILIDSAEKYADAEYYLVHDETQKTERVFGRNRTDGRSAYVERDRDGLTTSVFLQDATTLCDTEKNIELFKSETPIDEFAARFEAYQVLIDTSSDIDLSKLTVYADNPTKVTKVYLNGEAIDFKLAGRYIYFGDTPLLSGGDFGNVNPTTTSRPSGGGGGGGGGGSTGALKPTAAPETATPEPTATPETKPTAEPKPVTGDIFEAYAREIENHWGKSELEPCAQMGILQGDGATLNLDAKTTRAEFTAFLSRALDIEPGAYNGAFDDVARSDWFAGYVQAMKDAGLVDGVSERNFAPNNIITREQAAKMLVSTYNRFSAEQPSLQDGVPFADEREISDWAISYAKSARELGLMVGNDVGEFLPQNGMTRAEAAIVSYRLSNSLRKK